MTVCSCLYFKWGGTEEPPSKVAPSVTLAVSVPEYEANHVRTRGRPQSGNTAGGLWGLLSLSCLWVLADLPQKYWPQLLPTTISAGPWQGRRAGVGRVIHPCHSPIRLGNRLIFFFPRQWKATELQSLKPPAKVMFRAFRWTCSKSSRAGAAVPRGEQLCGLYPATCTGEGLGLTWVAVWVWTVERERCKACPPREALMSLISHFLLPTALTTDGCTEGTCIRPRGVVSTPMGWGFAEQDKEGRGS